MWWPLVTHLLVQQSFCYSNAWLFFISDCLVCNHQPAKRFRQDLCWASRLMGVYLAVSCSVNTIFLPDFLVRSAPRDLRYACSHDFVTVMSTTPHRWFSVVCCIIQSMTNRNKTVDNRQPWHTPVRISISSESSHFGCLWIHLSSVLAYLI